MQTERRDVPQRSTRTVLLATAVLAVSVVAVLILNTDRSSEGAATGLRSVEHLGAVFDVPSSWVIEKVTAVGGPIACDVFGQPPTVWLFEDPFHSGCMETSPNVGRTALRTGTARGLAIMPTGSLVVEEARVRTEGSPWRGTHVQGRTLDVVDPSGARVTVIIVDELGVHIRLSLGSAGQASYQADTLLSVRPADAAADAR